MFQTTNQLCMLSDPIQPDRTSAGEFLLLFSRNDPRWNCGRTHGAMLDPGGFRGFIQNAGDSMMIQW